MQRQIVIKGKGGLGNRILCAITGLLYSESTNRVPVIDWTDGVYETKGTNCFKKFFNPIGYEIQEHVNNAPDCYPAIWTDKFDLSISDIIETELDKKHKSKFIHQKLSIDVKKKDRPESTVFFWHYIDRINRLKKNPRNEHLRQKTKRQIIQSLLQNKMLLQDEIYEQIEEFKAKNFSEQMIGVHVRYTDRKGSLKKYLEYTKKERKKKPSAQIFLATDNQIVAQVFEAEFGDIIQTKKWLPKPGVPLHKSTDRPSNYQSGVEALIDMYLLAECSSLIYASNSTFSYISSCLTKAPKSDIHDIARSNIPIIINRLLIEIIP